jgi:NurA domain
MTSKLTIPAEQIEEMKRIRHERLEALKKRAEQIQLHPLPKGQPYKAIAISVDASNVPIETDVVDGVIIRCSDSDGKEYFQGIVTTDAPKEAITRFIDNLFQTTPILSNLLITMEADSWQEVCDFGSANTDLDRFVREMLEWGSLVDLAKQSSRTILLKDGFLRGKAIKPKSKISRSNSVQSRVNYLDNLRNFFEQNCRSKDNFLIGIAKESSVLEKYQVLLRYIKGFSDNRAFYLEIPEDILKETYGWRFLSSDYEWGRLYFVRTQAHSQGRVMTLEVPKFLENDLDKVLRILASLPVRTLPDRFRGLADPIARAHENTNLLMNFGKAIQKEIMQ